MKIKKGLALILALVMIITLMPTMAFAKTTNSVVKTYTVATDSDMPVVAIDLRADDSTGISANNVKSESIWKMRYGLQMINRLRAICLIHRRLQLQVKQRI